MAQTIETTSRTADELAALEARCEQLQALVGELLRTNQELRFKVAALKRQVENTERSVAYASMCAAMLLP